MIKYIAIKLVGFLQLFLLIPMQFVIARAYRFNNYDAGKKISRLQISRLRSSIFEGLRSMKRIYVNL